MTIQYQSRRRIVVTLTAVCLCLAAVSGAVGAVSGGAVTALTNSDVEAGQTSTHTLSYEADDVSADGTTDVVFVQFPDVYAGNLSFSTVSVSNRTSGATVPVSSSTSVVDGPDDDGVQETLRTGINHDANYATDDINATYEFSLSHPPVEETTSYDVTVVARDSMTERNEVTATDAITVVAGDAGTATATASPTRTDTAVETASGTTASADGTTVEQTQTTSTSTSAPGFGVGVALTALVAAAMLVGRRG